MRGLPSKLPERNDLAKWLNQMREFVDGLQVTNGRNTRVRRSGNRVQIESTARPQGGGSVATGGRDVWL